MYASLNALERLRIFFLILFSENEFLLICKYFFFLIHKFTPSNKFCFMKLICLSDGKLSIVYIYEACQSNLTMCIVYYRGWSFMNESFSENIKNTWYSDLLCQGGYVHLKSYSWGWKNESQSGENVKVTYFHCAIALETVT